VSSKKEIQMFDNEKEGKKIGLPEALSTPSAQGYVNQLVSAAVSEAVKSIFSELGPILRDSALTPEKLDLLRTPKQTPEQVAKELREKRESRKSREDEAELKRATLARQEACLHKYPNETDAINLVHNYVDRQARGICHICGKMIEPRRWVIDSPDPNTGTERCHIEEADKDYRRVLQKEMMGS
jgi:hypothetical protein